MMGMERALLQEQHAFLDLENSTCREIQSPEWTRFADDANEAIRLLQVKSEFLLIII